MVLTKKHWILIGVVIAILAGGILIYSGWTKQKSEPAESQPEQTKSKPMKQIMIPSSLNFEDIIGLFDLAPSSFWWKGKEENDSSSVKDFWELYFVTPIPGKGLTKYGNAIWSKKWIKKDGTEIHPAREGETFVLNLIILEYEKPELAQADYDKIITDYDKISTKQKFRDTDLKGVRLKTKTGMPPWWEEELSPYVKPEQHQQYFLHSNSFIIYMFGVEEAAEDAMIRIIDQYTVE